MSPRTRRVVWASTSLGTRGGVASCVRGLLATPLADAWQVRHVATHVDGSVAARLLAFARGLVEYGAALARRPAVVHLHTASYGSFVRKAVLAWPAFALRVPVVLHVHGGEFHLFHARSPRPLQWLITRTLERAAGVLALGELWRQRLLGLAPRANVLVVPNGVRAVDAVAQPVEGEPVHAVFLGDVTADKGVFVLLDAWAKTLAATPAARLTIGGAGELDRARAAVDELGISDSVELRGWIDPGEVPALLRTAHLLVLPSRAEGMPMVVLEAMANGLCVVASPVGGIPDMLGDDPCGVLVPPDDVDALTTALHRTLVDGGLRARLGAAALERVRAEFDIEVAWRRIDALYRSVLR
jgi:glycosyltransferase involved in cell wall biosynthesis